MKDNTDRRFHGSFVGMAEDAASFRGSNPVRFGFGEGAIVC